ncbi:acyl-CoA dehydrogenase family protein [Thalassobacillus sp. CUG 92003]|uniref:acyl-CoA dehydrogenase family protein n=1 Tax=Thalassobacillus sp. CUG 92003 TaxID=2736641 RepID=UPI0015E68146|nr:acyl-CoA dehydrogenase family protein [Thalassobacillus sp. CUG 92003]
MGEATTSIRGGEYLVSQINEADSFFPEDLSDEQLMIQKTARQFALQEVMPSLDAIEDQQFDQVVKLMKQAGDLGLLAHSVPEAYGGLGLDKISKGIVGEELGRTGSYGVAHFNHTCIATLPITYYGTTEQKEHYLPKLASGEYIGAYCLTEPEAGSDAMSGQTTAVLNDQGTHYLLNGTKIYITNAQFSDTFIVYAKVDGEQFTAFIVEKDFPGLSLGPEEHKMGIKGSSTRAVILDNCEVPKTNVLGDIGRGHVIAFTVLNLGRFNLGSACMGAAKHALKLTIAHIDERKQFKQRISEFGASKEKVAKMAACIYASESVQYRTSHLLETSLQGMDVEDSRKKVAAAMSEFAMECAVCKVYGSETLDHLVDEGVQLHGGAGFISEYRIEHMYRDSRINRIFEGTNEINRLLLTGQFLKKIMKGELAYEANVRDAMEQLHKGTELASQPMEVVKNLRAIYLVLVGQAKKQFGAAIETEQEVLMKLSELAILLYAAESSVLRTNKKQAQPSSLSHALMEALLEDTVAEALVVLRGLEDPLLADEPELAQTMYERLIAVRFPGSVARNRGIAEKLYEKGGYAV